jgi:hypothetical protein
MPGPATPRSPSPASSCLAPSPPACPPPARLVGWLLAQPLVELPIRARLPPLHASSCLLVPPSSPAPAGLVDWLLAQPLVEPSLEAETAQAAQARREGQDGGLGPGEDALDAMGDKRWGISMRYIPAGEVRARSLLGLHCGRALGRGAGVSWVPAVVLPPAVPLPALQACCYIKSPPFLQLLHRCNLHVQRRCRPHRHCLQ